MCLLKKNRKYTCEKCCSSKYFDEEWEKEAREAQQAIVNQSASKQNANQPRPIHQNQVDLSPPSPSLASHAAHSTTPDRARPSAKTVEIPELWSTPADIDFSNTPPGLEWNTLQYQDRDHKTRPTHTKQENDLQKNQDLQLIIPHINYCSQLWAPNKQNYIMKLEGVATDTFKRELDKFLGCHPRPTRNSGIGYTSSRPAGWQQPPTPTSYYLQVQHSEGWRRRRGLASEIIEGAALPWP
ncbi:hypothetical protein Pcinc_034852 [Petrolisthes cinctipes]|uniref:Uncharacterized protein n=1 Tax=Petrolisthes cinctipes TaxID=88211 RepID=A0AAE1ENU9_PETCI|nr:hypothetical protein Pcinc_034852 [Petrolisthes cinctipes]